MSEQPAGPPGLEVIETRIYYDPATGRVLHIHQLVSPPGEPLSADRVNAEMKDFEKALRQRSADLDYLTVDADEVLASEGGIIVDVEHRRLALRSDADGSA
jgi:hypothetical protein